MSNNYEMRVLSSLSLDFILICSKSFRNRKIELTPALIELTPALIALFTTYVFIECLIHKTYESHRHRRDAPYTWLQCPLWCVRLDYRACDDFLQDETEGWIGEPYES